MTTRDFIGKKVYVSGGTGGVGFAAAKQCARRGASLTVTGRSRDRGEAAVAELLRLGADGAHFLSGRSDDEEAVQRMSQEAVERMGGMNVMISAGADTRTGLKPFSSMTASHMRQTIDDLLYPRILPVHATIPHLKASGGGAIVMIGTDAARHPTPGESMVGAVGAAVIVLTKVLARELSRDRIRVNAVAMTITSDTPGWNRAFANEMARKVFTKAVERFPFGRPPNADEVGDAMVYLASDAAGQISGQTLSVNGALSFGGW